MAPECVLVTGGSRGIGAAITERLLADGHRVAVISRAESEESRAMRDQYGDRFLRVQADLAEAARIPETVERVRRTHGEISALVNNAGQGHDGALATQHVSDIEQVLSVNLLAPILLSRAVSRRMIRRRQGRIINITSIVARTGYSGLAVYAAAKAGMEGFTRSLARELGRVGITVNAIAPGFVHTDMTAGLPGEALETIARRSPLGLAEPTDVASAVSFLLSKDAGRITGITLTVDGGATA